MKTNTAMKPNNSPLIGQRGRCDNVKELTQSGVKGIHLCTRCVSLFPAHGEGDVVEQYTPPYEFNCGLSYYHHTPTLSLSFNLKAWNEKLNHKVEIPAGREMVCIGVRAGRRTGNGSKYCRYKLTRTKKEYDLGADLEVSRWVGEGCPEIWVGVEGGEWLVISRKIESKKIRKEEVTKEEGKDEKKKDKPASETALIWLDTMEKWGRKVDAIAWIGLKCWIFFVAMFRLWEFLGF